MLAYYSRHFPLVELNFTYYRIPTAAMLARLAEQTPAGFQFLVKLPRSLSHEEDKRELNGFRDAIQELSRRDGLLGLLCQLPQSIHDNAKHRAWLETLADGLADYHLAVEFRHRSWWHPEVPAWLHDLDLDLVSVDIPDLPSLYPRGLVQSGPRVYVRFHSRNAANWYRSDKERYNFDYDDDALIQWIEALTGKARSTIREVLLLFNNCHGGQAVHNARRMRELLARWAPGRTVVDPFARSQAGPRQGLLFE
jgi:uncharacterized protein YecE (DUF72 family)